MTNQNTLGIWLDHSSAHLININMDNEIAQLTQNLLLRQKKELQSKS